jgi:hypothetical protein
MLRTVFNVMKTRDNGKQDAVPSSLTHTPADMPKKMYHQDNVF